MGCTNTFSHFVIQSKTKPTFVTHPTKTCKIVQPFKNSLSLVKLAFGCLNISLAFNNFWNLYP